MLRGTTRASRREGLANRRISTARPAGVEASRPGISRSLSGLPGRDEYRVVRTWRHGRRAGRLPALRLDAGRGPGRTGPGRRAAPGVRLDAGRGLGRLWAVHPRPIGIGRGGAGCGGGMPCE